MLHLRSRKLPLPDGQPLAFRAKIDKPIDQHQQDRPAENVTDRHQREITDRKQTVGRALYIPL
jgi:hypothetical protein